MANVEQAAVIIGVSRRTIYTMLDDGRLQSTGYGRERRIDQESLDIQRQVSRPKRTETRGAK